MRPAAPARRPCGGRSGRRAPSRPGSRASRPARHVRYRQVQVRDPCNQDQRPEHERARRGRVQPKCRRVRLASSCAVDFPLPEQNFHQPIRVKCRRAHRPVTTPPPLSSRISGATRQRNGLSTGAARHREVPPNAVRQSTEPGMNRRAGLPGSLPFSRVLDTRQRVSARLERAAVPDVVDRRQEVPDPAPQRAGPGGAAHASGEPTGCRMNRHLRSPLRSG